MKIRRLTGYAGLLALAILTLPGLAIAAGQTYVKHQNLAEMVTEADRIYRGSVISIKTGEIEINGNSLPTTTYRVLVSEQFKGDVDEQKGEQQVAVLQVVGSAKKFLRRNGDFAQLSVLPAPPAMEVGSEYLLFTNAPNTHGLSNTIGLGQGYFHITFAGAGEVCTNALDNLGLFRDMGANMPPKGAIAYEELANLIRSEIANAGGQP